MREILAITFLSCLHSFWFYCWSTGYSQFVIHGFLLNNSSRYDVHDFYERINQSSYDHITVYSRSISKTTSLERVFDLFVYMGWMLLRCSSRPITAHRLQKSTTWHQVHSKATINLGLTSMISTKIGGCGTGQLYILCICSEMHCVIPLISPPSALARNSGVYLVLPSTVQTLNCLTLEYTWCLSCVMCIYQNLNNVISAYIQNTCCQRLVEL